ncbi:ABC transporter integral membrane protein [Streptomyces bingchenggensis BCW-1]|uniref:ABC transporter integral membrane protein n=1 Tax=Streptomyces bingchenggensis (strain BCW-1) TaxID=749414 RepID=D7CGB9_STRBB|nr:MULTISPECIES: FtsX-like permease family protein [Streptomyces]ADI09023.1 ABC transporter integral membrane protein [Streptomyces bingchenggensis BCW-1]
MLRMTLGGLRTRWTTLVGTFVALGLGVALIATMCLALASTLDAPRRGPERFAAAPVVVRGTDTLTVPVRRGPDIEKVSAPLAHPRPVPPELVARLGRLGPVTPDRTFPVRSAALPQGAVGHPWSAAAFTPYRLTAGRAPEKAGEVVVAGSEARLGDRVRIGTASGDQTRVVVGTVPRSAFESAVFFTDDEAARLSPRIDALVVRAPAAEVREAVAGTAGVRVLTGVDRRRADPDPDRDSRALLTVNALLGTAAGVTGFVSVFVVASTFAFAVAQRRREFGLLRMAGATPGQLRRVVLAEAAVVGVLASAAGCALGTWGAPWLARQLVKGAVAPEWFTIDDHFWPLPVAFSTGLLVALAGVWAAARRAGRVEPAEALREAAVDSRTMPLTRRLLGAGLLLAGVATLGWTLADDPGELLKRKTYTTEPMVLITAVGLLAPLLVRPVVRALGHLPARLPGATGILARESASAGVRRTASVAAPVLITVALTGSLLGAAATVSQAKAAELRDQTRADFVVTAGAGSEELSASAVRRVSDVPGALVSTSATTAVFSRDGESALVKSAARAVDPARLAAVGRLPVVSGSVRDLDDRGIVVNEEWERPTVGRRVAVWLGDGRKTTLRIVAVLRTGTGDNGAYVTWRNARGAAVDRIEVRLRPGADAAAVAKELRAAVRSEGGQVLTRDAWVAAVHPRTSPQTRLGLLVVVGIALIYAGIALAGTLVMATSDRIPELRALRLAGATTFQVLRAVAAEAMLTVAVGALLGVAVAGVQLLGLWGALGRLSVPASLAVPWGEVGAAVAACALLAVVSSVLPAWCALRPRLTPRR